MNITKRASRRLKSAAPPGRDRHAHYRLARRSNDAVTEERARPPALTLFDQSGQTSRFHVTLPMSSTLRPEMTNYDSNY